MSVFLFSKIFLRISHFHKSSSFTVPLTGDVNIITHRKIFEKLMQKNATMYSGEETLFFLSFKESQYVLRKKRIAEYCSTKDKNFGKKILPNSLIYDQDDGVSYCQIAKVASSSWCNHFIKLGKLDILAGPAGLASTPPLAAR